MCQQRKNVQFDISPTEKVVEDVDSDLKPLQEVRGGIISSRWRWQWQTVVWCQKLISGSTVIADASTPVAISNRTPAIRIARRPFTEEVETVAFWFGELVHASTKQAGNLNKTPHGYQKCLSSSWQRISLVHKNTVWFCWQCEHRTCKRPKKAGSDTETLRSPENKEDVAHRPLLLYSWTRHRRSSNPVTKETCWNPQMIHSQWSHLGNEL